MNIRFANSIEDVDNLAVMAYNFTKESKYVIVDKNRPRETYWPLIQSGVGAMLMLEDNGILVGGLGCLKYPDLHSGELFAVETFWYVLPEHRGAGLLLLEAYEKWARDNGCVKCAMIHMVDSMPEKLEVVYKRKGYSLIEKHYVKELSL